MKYSRYSSPDHFSPGLLVLCYSSSVVRASLTEGLDSFCLVKGFMVWVGWKGMNTRIVSLGQSGVVLGAVHLHGPSGLLGFPEPETRIRLPGTSNEAECSYLL